MTAFTSSARPPSARAAPRSRRAPACTPSRRRDRQPHAVPRLDVLEDRVACVDIEASRSEQSGTDIAGPERVTAAAVRSAEPLGLAERVDGEAPRAPEPALVARACERLEEREAVARGAVADAVSLLVAVGAGPPDQLGAGEQQLLVEILAGAGEDAGSAGAPLETDAAVSASELRPR